MCGGPVTTFSIPSLSSSSSSIPSLSSSSSASIPAGNEGIEEEEEDNEGIDNGLDAALQGAEKEEGRSRPRVRIDGEKTVDNCSDDDNSWEAKMFVCGLLEGIVPVDHEVSSFVR